MQTGGSISTRIELWNDGNLLWGNANEHEAQMAVILSVCHTNFFSAALVGQLVILKCL